MKETDVSLTQSDQGWGRQGGVRAEGGRDDCWGAGVQVREGFREGGDVCFSGSGGIDPPTGGMYPG